MSLVEARLQLPGMVAFDLQNYADCRLTEAGELRVDPTFKHNIYLELGRDLLELSKVDLPNQQYNYISAGMANGSPSNVFFLRNLSLERPDATIVIDTDRKQKGSIHSKGLGGLALFGGRDITIGRDPDTTPQLDLSDYASRRHMRVTMWGLGSLRFSDLGSTNGSTVYLHQEDARAQPPRREFAMVDGKVTTRRAIEQCWMR